MNLKKAIDHGETGFTEEKKHRARADVVRPAHPPKTVPSWFSASSAVS